jgi:hypothetical protein
MFTIIDTEALNPGICCAHCVRAVKKTKFIFYWLVHFFDDLRKQFIPLKYVRSPNMFRFSVLMSSGNDECIRNVCIFLYKALKARETALS